MKEYQIGEKTFIQKPLVLGQLMQIIDLLAGLQIPSHITVPGIIALLQDRLPRAMAIILCEPGQKLKEKDLDSLTDFMAEKCDLSTTLEVVENFFGLNNLPSILEKLAQMSQTVKRLVIGLKSSALSSAEEISHDETKSSGDTPSENASPILNTENVM